MSKHVAYSTTQALHRVFIAPYASSASSTLARQSQRHDIRSIYAQQTRGYAVRRKPKAAEVKRDKWNNDITAHEVLLIDPETDKVQGRPVSKSSVLARIDLTTHRLVQLVADEPNNPNFIPKCKIVSKKAMVDAERQRRENQREAQRTKALELSLKTIEMNWAIDQNDLGHRLDKLRQFLEEGRKVDVVMAAKKRGRVATPEECRNVISRVQETVDEVKGATASKPMEGKVGGVAMLSYQGKASANSEKPKAVVDE